MRSSLNRSRNFLANLASLVAFKLASRESAVRIKNAKSKSDTEFDGELGIVITTYESRQLSRALPLIEQIRKSGLTLPIAVVLNGNFSGNYNIKSRRKFQKELAMFDGVHLVVLRKFHGLSHNWNLGIRLLGCRTSLVLNDDVWVEINTFESELNRILSENGTSRLLIINNSFSHFIITEDCISKIGWFDERFLGIGEEDGDFFLRFKLGFGIEPSNATTNSIVHFNDTDGGEEAKGITKYSLANLVYTNLKYQVGEEGPGRFGELRTPNIQPNYQLENENFRRTFCNWENLNEKELLVKFREQIPFNDI